MVESWGSVETRMGHKETVLNTTKRKVKNGHLALNFLINIRTSYMKTFCRIL